MFAFANGLITYIVPFLFVLGLLVTVHEFGHFLAARLCGVAIDRFSIGFGKPLASWKDRQGVDWRIGWIPLGGYVRFAGDENAASVPDEEDLGDMRRRIEAREGAAAVKRYFHFKPIWQRAFITAAGPLANFLLSCVLFAILLGCFGKPFFPAKIDGVVPGSAAEKAGFLAGDMIRSVNGRHIEDFGDLHQIVVLSPNKRLDVEVDRGGRTLHVIATPVLQVKEDPSAGHLEVGALGIEGRTQSFIRYGPLEAVGGGVAMTWRTLSSTVYFLGQMITGHVSPSNISGVLGIAQASGSVAKAGAQGAPDAAAALFGSFIALLSLSAVMSVSIGFMNLLPVPVLDGGHLLFYAYEALARRPVGAKVQAAGYRVGLALLLSLMVFATWNDLQRLRVFQILGGLFS